MITLFIGGPEIVLIFLFALLFWGSKSIPDVAKMLGKGVKEFRKVSETIKSELDDSTSDLKKDLDEIKDNINKGSGFK